MKKMNLNKGFTLIELLIVIAIIGILSSVVLASLNIARAKGANAVIKSDLVNVRAQASIIYDDNIPNSYSTLCDDSNVKSTIAAVDLVSGAVGSPCKCFSDDNSWVIIAPLKDVVGESTHYCVDSIGKSIGATAADYAAITSTLDTLCP